MYLTLLHKLTIDNYYTYMVFVSQTRLFYNGQNVSNPANRNLINSIPKKTINVEVFVKRSAISYAIYYI